MRPRIVELQRRSSYGNDRIYPMNKLAHRVMEMIGRKTFFESDLEILKEMGLEVHWTAVNQDPVPSASDAS